MIQNYFRLLRRRTAISIAPPIPSSARGGGFGDGHRIQVDVEGSVNCGEIEA